MPSLLAIALSVLTLGLTGAPAQGRSDLVGTTFPATVVAIIDGDTIDIVEEASQRKVRVRLHGVDSPESGEPFSQRARTFMRVLLFDRAVTVEGRDVDRYGRLVARIRVGSRDASVELLREGLGCHYRQFSNDPVLEQAEQTARSASAGFWAAGAPQPACVQREARAAANSSRSPTPPAIAAGQVIGNVSSKVYHAPTCRNAHCKNCTRVFDGAAAADKAGYRPAGDCFPKR